MVPKLTVEAGKGRYAADIKGGTAQSPIPNQTPGIGK